jgi:hypothetical protein
VVLSFVPNQRDRESTVTAILVPLGDWWSSKTVGQIRLLVSKGIQPSQATSIVVTSHAEEAGTFLMVVFGMQRKEVR